MDNDPVLFDLFDELFDVFFEMLDHIRTEAGHGWGYIQQGNALDPSYDHAAPDPAFVEEYGLTPRTEHLALQQPRHFAGEAGGLTPAGKPRIDSPAA